MSEYDEIPLELFSRVAEHLAGRRVVVRSRHPVVSAYDGQAYRKGNEGIIDIDPGHPSQADQLYILTHESAHLKLHFDGLGENWNLPSNYYAQKWAYDLARKSDLDTIREEKEADNLSKIWINYAEQNYRDFGSDDLTMLERKLICLSHYLDPHTLEVIDLAVKSAVGKALSSLAGPRYDLVALDDHTMTAILR